MEAVNTKSKVIDLTRIGIKPESIAPEADTLTIRLSELLTPCKLQHKASPLNF